jgi:hypothetical protein
MVAEFIRARTWSGRLHVRTGTPPSDETLDPVADSHSPKDGGLGISTARLLHETEGDLWAPTAPFRP